MKALLADPTLAAKEEVKNLKEKVRMLMVIPDEDPTIATVTDIDKLKNQPFFSKAKKGDKVLIFTNAQKAILYDPVENKIVEAGPLILPSGAPANLSNNQTYALPTLTPIIVNKSNINVLLLNGTTTIGITKQAESKLHEKLPAFTVVDTDNAKVKSYTKSIVVAVNSNIKNETTALASLFSAETNNVAEGEQIPAVTSDGKNIDLVVILGSDFVKSIVTPTISPTPTKKP